MLLERRTPSRWPPHHETVCRLFVSVGGVVRAAQVCDLSARGVGLILSCPFETGTLLTVELINATKSLSLERRVRVVYAQQDAEEGWHIGLLFLEKLDADDLQALL